jgi:hypothetical protein
MRLSTGLVIYITLLFTATTADANRFMRAKARRPPAASGQSDHLAQRRAVVLKTSKKTSKKTLKPVAAEVDLLVPSRISQMDAVAGARKLIEQYPSLGRMTARLATGSGKSKAISVTDMVRTYNDNVDSPGLGPGLLVGLLGPIVAANTVGPEFHPAWLALTALIGGGLGYWAGGWQEKPAAQAVGAQIAALTFGSAPERASTDQLHFAKQAIRTLKADNRRVIQELKATQAEFAGTSHSAGQSARDIKRTWFRGNPKRDKRATESTSGNHPSLRAAIRELHLVGSYNGELTKLEKAIDRVLEQRASE